nr:MAG TPA: hypothetical protein [Caudoviricetes sp.]
MYWTIKVTIILLILFKIINALLIHIFSSINRS